MDTTKQPDPGSLEDDVEGAIDELREGVLAADATGMVGNEESIRLVELPHGEAPPPA